MPRKVRTHMTGDDRSDEEVEGALIPRALSRQAFGRRLYQLMLARDWNQSELARQAGLGRDAVSTYIRGKVLPTPQSLRALARALEVDVSSLLPNHTESAIDEDTPAFEMKVSPNGPSVAWLRVNRLVSLKTAVKIAEMLEADDVVEGKRSSQ